MLDVSTPAPTRRRRRMTGRMAATAVVLAMIATAGVSWAQDPPPTEIPGLVANVREYGAVGNGMANDTAAIQQANDAMFALGGGSVVFPAGTYKAMGVRQDSNVSFVSIEGARLLHLDGVSNTAIVEGRTTRTDGSISTGSNVLNVDSTNRVLPGAVVGIRAAGGASTVQATKLEYAVASSGLIVLSDPGGWRRNTANFLWIQDEIVSYTGMSGKILKNVRRGLFGTAAVAHPAGAPVAQAQGLYARVQSVGDDTIELDRPAVRGVTYADVWVGSVNMSVRGLTLDGNRKSGGSPNNGLPLRYALARWLTIEGCTIQKGDHGAITLDQGTSDSFIVNNVMRDNGDRAANVGSAVWLYRGARGNVVRDNEIGGLSYDGISVDDRSGISTEWDGPGEENLIQANQIDIPPVTRNHAIFVAGSNRNEIADNDVRSTKRGIAIVKSTQGIIPGDSEGNLVRDNRLHGHAWGLHVTGSYNAFERNVITSTMRPVVDTGVGNTYIWLDPGPTPTPTATAQAPAATPGKLLSKLIGG